MAQLHIQRRRRPLWPWLVGLLAGVLLIWLLFRTLYHPDPGEREPVPANQRTNAPGADSPTLQLYRP